MRSANIEILRERANALLAADPAPLSEYHRIRRSYMLWVMKIFGQSMEETIAACVVALEAMLTEDLIEITITRQALPVDCSVTATIDC